MIAFLFNVDAIHISKTVWLEPVIRQQINTVAEKYTNDKIQSVKKHEELNAPDLVFNVNSEQLKNMDLSLFWSNGFAPKSWKEICIKILGLILSGIAISQGSHFWFDLLTKTMKFASFRKE